MQRVSGSDGRYMSIDSGPSAVKNDSSRVSANVPGRSMGQTINPFSNSLRLAGRDWG